MTDSSLALDPEELFHLALLDSQNNRHDEAISKLRRCLDADAQNVRAQFMLAAEHAQIGMMERAAAEMSKVVEMAPDFAVAHFQLGLLYFSQGNYSEARIRWKPLDQMQDAQYLIHFRNGLQYLSDGALQESLTELDAGLASNTANPALNKDMQKVRGNVEQQLKGVPPASADNVSVQRALDTTYRQ